MRGAFIAPRVYFIVDCFDKSYIGIKNSLSTQNCLVPILKI